MSDEDWRGWKDGKYDDRYRGVKKRAGRRSSKGIIIGVIIGGLVVASFFLLDWSRLSQQLTETNLPEVAEKNLGVVQENLPKSLSLVNAEDAALAIHEEVNRARERYDLPTLLLSPALSKAAIDHSTRMANEDFYDHRGFEQRASICSGVAAENLYIIDTPLPIGSSAVGAQAVHAWLDSPMHRDNLLGAGFAVEGIGVYVGAMSLYITQILC